MIFSSILQYAQHKKLKINKYLCLAYKTKTNNKSRSQVQCSINEMPKHLVSQLYKRVMAKHLLNIRKQIPVHCLSITFINNFLLSEDGKTDILCASI